MTGLDTMGNISIHAPREGGDFPHRHAALPVANHFNPRPPRGGRRMLYAIEDGDIYISIHAPREGGDSGIPVYLNVGEVISIHAPREGGDCKEFAFYWIYFVISIHAPREGGDRGGDGGEHHAGISIHAPREGGDIKSKP